MEDIGEVEALSGSQLATKVMALTSLVFTPFIVMIIFLLCSYLYKIAILINDILRYNWISYLDYVSKLNAHQTGM